RHHPQLTFKQLKNELPKLDGDPAQSKEDKEDKRAVWLEVVQRSKGPRRCPVQQLQFSPLLLCPDDPLTVDEMKKVFDCGGQQPLRLCASCAELKIKPPMTNAATSFVEKKKQRKATKKRRAKMFQAIGGKKAKE
ncbi:hypothetical protein THAOC_18166, partial [Thalassiosira oceanica]